MVFCSFHGEANFGSIARDGSVDHVLSNFRIIERAKGLVPKTIMRLVLQIETSATVLEMGQHRARATIYSAQQAIKPTRGHWIDK